MTEREVLQTISPGLEKWALSQPIPQAIEDVFLKALRKLGIADQRCNLGCSCTVFVEDGPKIVRVTYPHSKVAIVTNDPIYQAIYQALCLISDQLMESGLGKFVLDIPPQGFVLIHNFQGAANFYCLPEEVKELKKAALAALEEKRQAVEAAFEQAITYQNVRSEMK